MGNVNLPTPVVLAGAGLCLLGGYLVGVVAGPDTPERTIGVVESYESSTQRMCLVGDGVDEHEGADDGRLCGIWQRAGNSPRPEEGDQFRFVSILTEGLEGPEDDRVAIFGEVDR
ncbi:hypothetical protein [Nocardioides donggukensis]|uniref:Uncharacterized protein n=1 Tax=Nocardioides donggukensis TaxID=2774019 RepID=A0A927K485_9ACTN|nr:hypothetical protein [Nocardioides donggukensis]MBD8869797.1 hypothetical protein [Nocardioides donggukensis]